MLLSEHQWGERFPQVLKEQILLISQTLDGLFIFLSDKNLKVLLEIPLILLKHN
jgi:hypothetical protein